MLTRYNLQWSRSFFLRIGVLVASVLLFTGIQAVSAQQLTVEGTVLDAESGTPLPGVNVLVVGTQRGTATSADGTFEIQVPSEDDSLRFSYVGYQSKTVPLEGRSELTVELQAGTEQLENVVVTALGIERKRKSLGYAVSKVSGEDVAEVSAPSLADALSGKAAGVDISNTATGPAGASNVTIRGISSLTGDNQPLYVVDGVPLNNSNLVSASKWGGSDMGDALTSINPQDIKSISVLKGAAAAALYGQRATDGVVRITTKSGGGAAQQDLGIEFTSKLEMNRSLNYFDDIQNQYGHGFIEKVEGKQVWRGQVPSDQAGAQSIGLSSWGPKMSEVDQAVQYDGEMRPYAPVGDNKRDFYRTGLSSSNSIALNGGSESTTFRLSMSHRRDQAIVPNSGFNRTTFLGRASSDFGLKALNTDVKFSYVRENASNRPRVSDSPGNPNYAVALLPPSVDVNTLKPGWVEGNKFEEFAFSSSPFQTNPYWAVRKFSADDTDDRIRGFVNTQYNFTSAISAEARFEMSQFWTRRTQVEPFGTAYDPGGEIDEDEWNTVEYNASVRLNATYDLTPSFNFSGRIGGSMRHEETEFIGAFGDNFNIPGLRTLSNTQNQTPSYNLSKEEVWSVYGTADVSYNNYLFLTFSGRTDVSSTLPVNNNGFFYPSVQGSFVFSDALDVPEWISYGKIRGSWGRVGGDTSPYQLRLKYGLRGGGHVNPGQGKVPIGYIASGSVPNAELEPSFKETIEAGLEIGVFNDRLGLDLTLYQETNRNDIVPTTISSTSGYGSRVLNVGKTRNQGIELALRSTPIQTESLEWNLVLNASKNSNEVVKLTEDLDRLNFRQPRTRNARVVAEEGEPYGAIKAFKFKRDDQGRLILDSDGLPQARDTLTTAGYFPPDWRGGITNTLNYKGFTFRALLDVQIGGDIFSGTNSILTSNGLHEQTLRGREQGYVEVKGVDSEGNPVTSKVAPDTYWGRIASDVSDQFVYDASYVKLRELRLGYRFSSLLEGLPVQAANVALTGRNLWILHKNVPNVDPESTYNRSTQFQGLEYFGVPQSRSYGLSLTLRF
ncbi:MAG: SusC/RagA family TonB-linked outer membrane protein [Salinibacter sp.]|uniref:SusC/RagA family TonB-linked outer membrane protein n=1 Tax=Salinibacter sp. TaxID=2065818 RepID=UPI0035D43AC0